MRPRRPRAKSVRLTIVLGCLLVWLGLAAANAGFAPAPEAADPQGAKPAAPAAKPAAAPAQAAAPVKFEGATGPGTWFLHEHHSGQVPVPGKSGQTRELKCETCHAVAEKATDTNRFPGPDLEKNPDLAARAGMGTKLGGLGFPKAHSACTECHSQIGPGSKWNCGNCHVSTAQLKVFPNPAIQLSQFADKFAHKDHSSSKCSECHDDGAQGVAQLLPKHQECFVCHSYKKDGQEPLANNCTGCHANLADNKPTVDPKLKAPKNPYNAVAAELLTPRTFVTPAAPNKPFNHTGGAAMYHSILKPDTGPQAGKTLKEKAACNFCHFSATKATSREQMLRFAAKKDAPAANQPPASACVVCHVHETQMWVADGKVPTAVQQKACKSCHTAADAAKAPPASHMPIGGTAPPATTTPATTTPETKPETKPATPPATKPETKPATKPETKPAIPEATMTKPTTPPATKPPAAPPETKPATPPATKPETKPETKPATPETKPATPETKPATPEAKPPATTGPVAAHGKYDQWATKNPDGSAPSKSQPTGELQLGSKSDPSAGSIWGQTKATASFNHANHVKPNYAASCEVCHHTNTDAKTEGVLKCVACHKESGNEKNPATEDGSEVDVKAAYHGLDDGKLEAGCITCHTKRGKGPTGCAECHNGKASVVVTPDPLNLVACHGAPFAPADSFVESAIASVVQLPPSESLAVGRRFPFTLR